MPAAHARAGRQAEHDEHDARIRAPLEHDLKRAGRSIAVLRATLTEERARAREAIEMLEALERDASAAGPGREWYTAIVALLRARRALGVP